MGTRQRIALVVLGLSLIAANVSAQYVPLTPPLSAAYAPLAPLPLLAALPSLPAPGGPPAIVARDGQFLGVLSSNRYDSLSVSNPYGQYGSKYSSTSIHNPYSVYGSKYSSLSPNNPYATSPPILVSPGSYRVLTPPLPLLPSIYSR